MRIILVPETEQEKAKYGGNDEIVHSDVREFLIFGNKVDSDNDLVDFHEWTGTHRYLIGSLEYFSQTINDERRSSSRSNSVIPKLPVKSDAKPFIKRGSVQEQNFQPIDMGKLSVMNFPEDKAEEDKVEEEYGFREYNDEVDEVDEDPFGESRYEDELNINISTEQLKVNAEKEI